MALLTTCNFSEDVLYQRRFNWESCKTFWVTISREALLLKVVCEVFRTGSLFSRIRFVLFSGETSLIVGRSVSRRTSQWSVVQEHLAIRAKLLASCFKLILKNMLFHCTHSVSSLSTIWRLWHLITWNSWVSSNFRFISLSFWYR